MTTRRNRIDWAFRYRAPREATFKVAEFLGLNPNTLYKSLNGTIPISDKTARALADFSGMEPEDIKTAYLDHLNRFVYCDVYPLIKLRSKLLLDKEELEDLI